MLVKRPPIIILSGILKLAFPSNCREHPLSSQSESSCHYCYNSNLGQSQHLTLMQNSSRNQESSCRPHHYNRRTQDNKIYKILFASKTLTPTFPWIQLWPRGLRCWWHSCSWTRHSPWQGELLKIILRIFDHFDKGKSWPFFFAGLWCWRRGRGEGGGCLPYSRIQVTPDILTPDNDILILYNDFDTSWIQVTGNRTLTPDPT